MNWSDFSTPTTPTDTKHHHEAASRNATVVAEARTALLTALTSPSHPDAVTHLLLKAAAGAGKSHALRDLIVAAAGRPGSRRIGVAAFTNNQIRPLAEALGELLPGRVCLHLSKDAGANLPASTLQRVAVSTTATAIPNSADVIVTTASKLRAPGEKRRLIDHLGATRTDHLYDVLFIDEAWQLPHHLYDAISSVAPLIVGVGDVGQLPPLEIGENPWRGDPRHNPYRAWPEAYVPRQSTWERELPAVWRPAGEALGLWRAFYPEWEELNSVAAPGDRAIILAGDTPSAPLWRQVGTCQPTMLEIHGLPASEAPDVDLPVTAQLEQWLDELFTAGFSVQSRHYEADGTATRGTVTTEPGADGSDHTLVVILATRNQAVDDAQAAVERLRAKHGLGPADLVASTVDSWQGRTNALTIAIHPLSGAAELDEFNSAFGRLAVACTRSTHGMLLLARGGVDELIRTAPARPGTPFGEPGARQLPRQTHQRILSAFARGTVDVTEQEIS